MTVDDIVQLQARIADLERMLVYKDLALDQIKRKAQWVADRAYNKGVRDACAAAFAPEELIKTPRHNAEFTKPEKRG